MLGRIGRGPHRGAGRRAVSRAVWGFRGNMLLRGLVTLWSDGGIGALLGGLLGNLSQALDLQATYRTI